MTEHELAINQLIRRYRRNEIFSCKQVTLCSANEFFSVAPRAFLEIKTREYVYGENIIFKLN